MSDIERNKGKLIPVTEVDILHECPSADLDDLNWTTEGKFEKINGTYYEVQFEVRKDNDCFFAYIDKDLETGVISFHTMHYNGGAHWTEVIEGELK